MKHPPAQIDGAQVIEYAWSDEPFGVVAQVGGGGAQAIHGLAICRYQDSEVVYRFSCDENWNTLQDADYACVEEAKDLLPEQYRNAPVKWRKLDEAD